MLRSMQCYNGGDDGPGASMENHKIIGYKRKNTEGRQRVPDDEKDRYHRTYLKAKDATSMVLLELASRTSTLGQSSQKSSPLSFEYVQLHINEQLEAKS